ncbi:MAG: AIPR family protein [Caldilineaceae bacterium]|nr:AIPR family protein [Caldilineaceae bacterium]
MYEKIRDEITREFYKQNFSNDGQRFVAWYVHNIHGRDMIETREDVTDGPDDKHIDAIVVDDDNNTVYVIQGKFIGEGRVDAEPLREVLASWSHFKDIAKLQETGNQKLKQRLSEVATAMEDDYSVAFELIVTGQLTESARADYASFQKTLASSDDFPAEIYVIDSDELQRRYDIALERENPLISHRIQLDTERYMVMEIGGTNCVVAAIPLKDCIEFPGIKDGTLFQKNVRQSLGLNNRVNKGIKASIYGTENQDFFFYHNGITAICNNLDISNGLLTVKGFSVVNGCQSLNTILSCSEKVKELDDAFIMMRFYEIPERERADQISVSTNSQSAVKPRDLRSNDRRVLAIKRSYEGKYPQGYFITKRGEEAPANKDRTLVVDLLELGKYMIAWHSQRPNISYSENKIFDKHFEQLFSRHRDYAPENVFALSHWMQEVRLRWKKDNPLGLNESLLAMQAYAPFHHLYAVSLCFCVANNMGQGVPDPVIAYERADTADLVSQVVDSAGACLNSALEAAANEPQPPNRVFSPQNWIKTKSCLAGIRLAINQYFMMLPAMPNGRELHQRLREGLKMDADQFKERWAAD